ncbi:hypothetical protein F5Y08DRAFT_310969 [Xylaria arbuscula]|nr:hypothetical protein F5Y08DRAFT_310969 [Xylaria arbuscula]
MESTTFRYLQWNDRFLSENPYQILIDLPEESEDQKNSNVTFENGRTENVANARPDMGSFKLDTHGFCFSQIASKLHYDDFFDKKKVDEVYLPECADLIRSVLDSVDKIHFYNWLVRDSNSGPREGKVLDLNDSLALLGPARVVHVDQTPESAIERVFLELPSTASDLLKGRLRLVNIWRPIRGPVEMWPLALCDGRTVSPSSLVSSDRVRRNYTGGTTFVLEDSKHKWFYLDKQQVDEVAVFKNFDSDPEVTKCAPHTSFPSSGATEGLQSRQSIEVRAMVFSFPTKG